MIPRLALLAMFSILALASGCETTHPRRADVLPVRWPDVRKVAVLRGSVQTEVKNYLAADYFTLDRLGEDLSLGVARWVRLSLRERRRETVFGPFAEEKLGGTSEKARADVMLAHAREWMEQDPEHRNERLKFGPVDLDVVPAGLAREFDAILVVGGRTKFETTREWRHRLVRAMLDGLWMYPLLALTIAFPPILPFTFGLTTASPSFRFEAASDTYWQVALYDGPTRRLLYVNDWYERGRRIDEKHLETIARDLVDELLNVRKPRPGEIPPTPRPEPTDLR